MTIYLVSNAEAVPSDAWQLAAESLRPLTRVGYAQATALACQLETTPLDIVLAAPVSRCIDTVLPLTLAHGLEVRTRHDLLPPGVPAFAIELLNGRSRVLLCAEGAVVSDLLAGLVADGPEPASSGTVDPGEAAAMWKVELGPEGPRAERLPAVVPAEGAGWYRRRRSGVVVGGGGRY